jgi:hypothetical protein
MWWAAGVQFLAAESDYSVLHTVQTGSEAHTASYPMGNRIFSPGAKRQGREADRLYLVPRSRIVELYLHSP